MPFPSSGSEHSIHRQVDFLWFFFWKKKAFTDNVSQGEIRKDSLMQGAAACEGDLNVNLLKRNALLQLWICFPNNAFQYNTKAQIKIMRH